MICCAIRLRQTPLPFSFFFQKLDNSKQFLSSHFGKKNGYWYFRKGQILSVITRKLGSCKFSSMLITLLYFTFWSAILFSEINFSIVSIAFTLCFVTKCTRFTLSLELTIQLLIQIRKLSHESSTSRRGNIQNYYNKTNNFTYESFFSVSFYMVAVIILFFFNVRTSPCYKEMFYQ